MCGGSYGVSQPQSYQMPQIPQYPGFMGQTQDFGGLSMRQMGPSMMPTQFQRGVPMSQMPQQSVQPMPQQSVQPKMTEQQWHQQNQQLLRPNTVMDPAYVNIRGY